MPLGGVRRAGDLGAVLNDAVCVRPGELIGRGATGVGEDGLVGSGVGGTERDAQGVAVVQGVDCRDSGGGVNPDLCGPFAVLVGGVADVLELSELKLDRGGLVAVREEERILLGVVVGSREVVDGVLERLHGRTDLGGGHLGVLVGGLRGIQGLVQGSNGGSGVVVGVDGLGLGDDLVKILIDVSDGDSNNISEATDDVIAVKGKGDVELAVAVGAAGALLALRHAARGDGDGGLVLARCEGDLLGSGVEVILRGGAGLKANVDRELLRDVADATERELVGGVLVHREGRGLEVHHRHALGQEGGGVDANGALDDADDDRVLLVLEGVGGVEQRRGVAGAHVVGGNLDDLAVVNLDAHGPVAGIGGADDVELGAGELEGESGAGVARPLARALIAGGDGLVGPRGAVAVHVHVVDGGETRRDGRRDFECRGGLVDADLGDLREGLLAGEDLVDAKLDLDGVRGDLGGADEALGADGGTGAKLLPGAVVGAVAHLEGVDALTVLDGLLDGDDVEGLLLAELHDERLVGRICGAPEGVLVAVEDLTGAVRRVVLIGGGRLGGAAGGEVVVEAHLDVGGKLLDARLDLGVNGALIVGRDVDEQRGAVADGVEVHRAQVLEGLGRALVGPPEPAGGDAGVRLGDGPEVAVGVTNLNPALSVGVVVGVGGVELDGRPELVGGGAHRGAVLVADPADAGVLRALEDDAILGLELVDGVGPTRVVVDLRVGARALGAVHPDLDELALVAVLGVAEDLLQLPDVVLVVVDVGVGGGADAVGHALALVGVIAVRLVVDVPRREVETHVDVVLRAGLGEVGEDVALAVLVVGDLLHVVVGVLRLPDAEAVVVLGRHNEAREARVLDHLDVAVGIEARELVHVLVGLGHAVAVALAPLDVGEGVRAKVAEGRKRVALVVELAVVGQRLVLRRRRRGRPGKLGIRHVAVVRGKRHAGSHQRKRQCRSGGCERDAQRPPSRSCVSHKTPFPMGPQDTRPLFTLLNSLFGSCKQAEKGRDERLRPSGEWRLL